MQGRDNFSQILGIRHPWMVADVTTDAAKQVVTVLVERVPSAAFFCMTCGKECPGYDTRRRQWRHLDTCQYKTIVVADVPRIECPEHGVQQVAIAWAEANSRFTGLFEALAINWLREASILAVARLMHLTWREVDGIMLRAVIRGFARRDLTVPERMGVDETSFQKRHEYVTVVADLEQCDKFHVARHLGDAVDKVRRDEHAALMAVGDWTLKGTKHVWLANPANMKDTVRQGMFEALKATNLKTSRAWALNECAMGLWHFSQRGGATVAWNKWINWARRCHLEPMKKVAAMVRHHLQGIVNAIVLRATNAASESINSKIQKVKRMACGFRNRARFRNAIYFHLGGLDLFPTSAMATHTMG